MSDLKTALQTAIERARSAPPAPPPAASAAPAIPSDWDDEGGAKEIKETTTKETAMQPAHLFQPTNNVSRETFNYVRDHQGCTRAQLMQDLTARGFNPRSLSALLAQMFTQGMLRGTAKDGLFTTIDEYRPIKQRKALREAQPRRKKVVVTPLGKGKAQDKRSLKEKKAALRKEADTFNPEWSPRAVLEGLSVIQARAVYDELKKLFGG